MGYTKTIVCLANSRKPPSGGRCIAGREYSQAGFGPWVRPVSARPTAEISEEERRYEDGTDPAVLDVVRISMVEPRPRGHQQENHLIDDGIYWSKVRRLTWADLESALERPSGPLWTNGCSSSHGENDRIPEREAAELSRSLYLIRPLDLVLVVALEGERRKLRARFKLGRYSYSIVVTDPRVERSYFSREDGDYPLEEALLCVSLGEPFHGYTYKLAAAVIRPA